MSRRMATSSGWSASRRVLASSFMAGGFPGGGDGPKPWRLSGRDATAPMPCPPAAGRAGNGPCPAAAHRARPGGSARTVKPGSSSSIACTSGRASSARPEMPQRRDLRPQRRGEARLQLQHRAPDRQRRLEIAEQHLDRGEPRLGEEGMRIARQQRQRALQVPPPGLQLAAIGMRHAREGPGRRQRGVDLQRLAGQRQRLGDLVVQEAAHMARDRQPPRVPRVEQDRLFRRLAGRRQRVAFLRRPALADQQHVPIGQPRLGRGKPGFPPHRHGQHLAGAFEGVALQPVDVGHHAQHHLLRAGLGEWALRRALGLQQQQFVFEPRAGLRRDLLGDGGRPRLIRRDHRGPHHRPAAADIDQPQRHLRPLRRPGSHCRSACSRAPAPVAPAHPPAPRRTAAPRAWRRSHPSSVMSRCPARAPARLLSGATSTLVRRVAGEAAARSGCGARLGRRASAARRPRRRASQSSSCGSMPCNSARNGQPALRSATVDRGAVGQQPDVRRVGADQVEPLGRQRRAQVMQNVAQPTERVGRLRLRPQQPGEQPARHAVTRRQGEQGDHRARARAARQHRPPVGRPASASCRPGGSTAWPRRCTPFAARSRRWTPGNTSRAMVAPTRFRRRPTPFRCA